MTRIKKAVAAAAATLCMSAPAMAQVSIYGTLDLSVGQFQNAGGTKDKRVDSGNMTTSFIGFKGSEDLGGGLKANFAIEHFLGVDAGTAGRFPGDKFWARSANISLSGDFGAVTVGRAVNQYFVSTLIFNAFGDAFGFSPAIRQILIPHTLHDAPGTPAATARGLPEFYGDTGWSNSITYSSPSFSGLSFNAQVTSKEADGGVGGNFGANALYFGGPISATVAVQKVKGQSTATTPATLVDQQSVLLGAGYDLKVVKLFAEYATRDTDLIAGPDSDTKVFQIGVSAPLAGGTAMAQYGNSKAEYFGGATKSNKTLSLGYTYFLSKRTDVYAVYMNDKLTGVSAGNTLAGGIRVRF